MYKVLITTSGTGSRLGPLTHDTNKALVTIGRKKVIDHIISAYPINTTFVITIGYFGENVIDYITMSYSNRNISFVKVLPFEGPGSSLGYSMLQAEDLLQCPFIFHCNDTIVKETVPSPQEFNWNGVSKGLDPNIFNSTSYSSVTIKNGLLSQIHMKGVKTYDALHIGLVGIKDYAVFWEELKKEYNTDPNNSSLNDVGAISHMISRGIQFKAVEFREWYDTGNLSSLADAKAHLNDV